MINKLSQVSVEYLVLAGFLTFIIIGILGAGLYYSSTLTDRIKSSDASNYANKIISTSESVFYAGEPSKATITAYLPENVKDIEIIEDNIVITIGVSTGTTRTAFKSKVPILENPSSLLSNSQGIKKIIITTNSTNVIISQG